MWSPFCFLRFLTSSVIVLRFTQYQELETSMPTCVPSQGGFKIRPLLATKWVVTIKPAYIAGFFIRSASATLGIHT